MKSKKTSRFSFKWMLMVAGIVLVSHLVLLIPSFPNQKKISKHIPLSSPPFIVFNPIQIRTKMMSCDWSDPTVFTLPTDMGFSSSLRSRFPSMRRIVSESVVSPFMQTLNIPSWTQEEDDSMASSTFSSLPSLISLDLRMMASEPNDRPFEEGSSWRVLGELADRLPSTTTSLPVVQSSDLVSPTIIRIAVNPLGDTVFAILDQSSGNEKADDSALQFVKMLRFNGQISSSNLKWGVVKILWRTERILQKS